MLTLVGTGVAVADNLVADGDLLTAGTQSTVDLGEVCAGATVAPTAANVRLVVSRQGNYSTSNVFRKGSSVSLTAGAATVTTGAASVAATPVTVHDATIAIPATWDTASNNTVTGDTGTATLGLTAGSTPGEVSVRRTFTATGVDADGDPLTRSADVTLVADVVDCAPTGPVDTTAPTSSASAATTAGAYTFGDWTRHDVVLTLTGSDEADGSGLKEIRFTTDGSTPTATTGTVYDAAAEPVVTAEGTTTVRFAAVDQAGNVESPAQQVVVRIDRTAPGVEHVGSAGAEGQNGWYVGDVTATFRATDGLSGFAGLTDPHTFTRTTSGEGSAVDVASGPVTDVAGNTGTGATSPSYRIDLVDPTVTCDTAGPFVLGSTGTVTATVADTVSGSGPVAPTVQATADTSEVGTRSVTLTGRDVAGRSGSATCSYSVVYDWTGFFRPIDNLPTLNTVKAGSAVPVKFALGGDQGLDVMAAGYPRSTTVTCGSTAPVDAVEETVTAGGSSLSYDTTTGQYTYVWKTDKTWAGSCRQLVVQLDDGTFHRAAFKLMK